MELERRSIERADFPLAADGYSREAVDAHLRAIADAADELARRPAASAAAEQVRAIVAAAEASAGEIEADARQRAERVAAEAERGVAGRLQSFDEAAGRLRARADALEAELDAVLDRLRAAGGALVGALREGAASLEAGAGATEPAPEARQPDAPAPDVPGPERREATAAPPAAPAEPAAGASGAGRGGEGARLIALNMALGGTPREETARYLVENFELDDVDAILAEVYSRAGT